MKKIQLFLISILSCTLLFSSCDEEKDNKLFLLHFAGAKKTLPVVSLSASASPIAEDSGTSTITASIPAASRSDVTVVLGFGGTATATMDYITTGSATIVIPSPGLHHIIPVWQVLMHYIPSTLRALQWNRGWSVWMDI
jgi:hypothetical protein